MGFTLAYDVTAENYAQAPQNAQLCGYDTGPGVAWTAAMWAAHPGAVHIDQAPDTAGDITADVLDVEAGAIPVASPEIAQWAHRAQAAYDAALRPGQRCPAIYCSLSNVTANVNALIAGGVTDGVGLWIADWGLSEGTAIADVLDAAGPFPIIGMQIANLGADDFDVLSSDWLGNVSGDGWVFGPVRGFKCWPGETTFGVSGYSPGIPAPLGVLDYEIVACEGTQLGAVLKGYPYYLPKNVNSSAWQYEGHGLTRGKTYTVGVRAQGPGGAHSGPWALATITTSLCIS